MRSVKMALLLNPSAEYHLWNLLEEEKTIVLPEIFAKLEGYFTRPGEEIRIDNSVLRLWDVNLDEVDQLGDRPFWFYLQRFFDYLLKCNGSTEVRFLYQESDENTPFDQGNMDLGPFENAVDKFMPGGDGDSKDKADIPPR